MCWKSFGAIGYDKNGYMHPSAVGKKAIPLVQFPQNFFLKVGISIFCIRTYLKHGGIKWKRNYPSITHHMLFELLSVMLLFSEPFLSIADHYMINTKMLRCKNVNGKVIKY